MSELYDREEFTLDLDTEMGGTTPKAKPRDRSPDMLQLDDDLNLLGDETELGLGGSEPDMQAGIGEEISEIHEGDITATTLGLDQLESLRSPHDGAQKEDEDMSPLSSVRSSVERELEAERQGDLLSNPFTLDQPSRGPTEEPEQAATHTNQQAQARKRKVVVDSVTEIRAKQIRSQQDDRSKILKDPSFLPRDPGVLALVTLQRTGGFATSVFYPKNIHPDLASMLSPEFVKRMAAMKRKREEVERAETVDGTERGDGTPAKRIQLDLGDDSMLEHLEAAEAARLAEREKSAEEDENGDEGEMIDFPRQEDLQLGHGDDFAIGVGDESRMSPSSG